ncbi:MAG: hypothetical protein EPN21_15485, partial [Methylococcaceae bacterium]
SQTPSATSTADAQSPIPQGSSAATPDAAAKPAVTPGPTPQAAPLEQPQAAALHATLPPPMPQADANTATVATAPPPGTPLPDADARATAAVGGEVSAADKHAAPLAAHEGRRLETEAAGIALEPALKALSHQAEGALAKLVLNQLASLPQPDANQQIWRVDIPFTLAGHAESAKLEIEREDQRAAREGEEQGGKPSWSVTVDLSPPGLGKLGGKLTLYDHTINAFFWSENPITAELIRDNLPLLQARLESVGLKTGELNAAQGVSPHAKDKEPHANLLDLRA